jgi:hypothetical protein
MECSKWLMCSGWSSAKTAKILDIDLAFERNLVDGVTIHSTFPEITSKDLYRHGTLLDDPASTRFYIGLTIDTLHLVLCNHMAG